MLQPTVSLVLDDQKHPARQLGVAVVGLGDSGPDLLRVLGESVDAEVRWLCDVDSSRLARYRRRHPQARVTTRLDRILTDRGVDAVVLATPVDKHYELAMRALDAGKHVFVTSALATSAERADDLAATGRERRRIVMCGHTLLYSPPVRAIKRMIDAGTLGDVYYVSSSRSSLGPDQRVGSVIWDLGPHDFSALLYWLSEMPLSVRAFGRDSMLKGIADVAFVTMNFPSGIVVNVELSWLASGRLRRTTIVGRERTVVYECDAPEQLRLFDCGVVDRVPQPLRAFQPAYRGGDIVSPKIESYEPLAMQMGDFIGAIRAGDLMEHQTALAHCVVQIAQAADESLRLGGADISPAGYGAVGQLAARRGLAAV